MKKSLSLFTLLLTFCVMSFGQNDAISKYFEKYVDNEDFTVVFISPKMFEMISKLELENMVDEDDAEDIDMKEVREMIGNIKSVRVLETHKNAEMYYKEAVTKINTKDYELLVSVRDGGENVRIWTKASGDIIHEVFLLVGAKDEFVMVSLVGDIDLNQISKLAKTMNVNGLEHLEKVN